MPTPTPTPEPTPEPIPEPVQYVDYTVKKGDTLNAIAKKYSTTLSAILAVNPAITNPNKIYVGQIIKIPVPTQQSSTSAIPKEQVWHTVQKGETLSGIVKKYGTNYIRIAALNHIVNPNKIYVGQKLRVR
jgi:LysM repeat protein